MWIKRDISPVLSQNTNFIEVLTGPRQCGKSSLFFRLDSEFIEISLDDLHLRERINQDPMSFLLENEGKKLLIDEAQLSPPLFSALKRQVDLMKRRSQKRQTYFRLTGSNQILMDKNIKESLSGRASYFELNTLSVAEILDTQNIPIGEILFKGGWPELYTNQGISTIQYLNDYLRTYVEKDIVLSAGIQKQFEFFRFAKLLAGRTGCLINFSELSKELGISADTVREWTSLMERMKLIALVHPYFSNSSKRLIKTPKMYFLDTGLACRLQGHSELGPLYTSPSFGHLFESLVYAEIYKTKINFSRDWEIYHWRSRDGEEVDFLIQKENGEFLFIEAKVQRQSLSSLENYTEIRKVFKDKIPPIYLCHLQGEGPQGRSIPLGKLRDVLLK